MAFWGEGNIFGGWQGLMGRKKRWPNTGPPGLVPRRMPTAPYQGMEPTATEGVADSAWDTMPKKKGSMIKDIADALKDLKPGPDAPELAGRKFGRCMPAQLGFSLASMGGRLGEQQAMTQARREEELQRRRKLLYGGYA